MESMKSRRGRWCGDRARGAGKRRGVELCKTANLGLTQQSAVQRCSDVTYTDPLAYISYSSARRRTHTWDEAC